MDAWADYHSMAVFEDCHWGSKFDIMVVELWYQPGASGRTRNLIQSSSGAGSSTSIVDTLYNDILENHPMRELVSIVEKKNHRGFSPSSPNENANRRTQGYAAMSVDLLGSSFEKNQVDAGVASSGGIVEFYDMNLHMSCAFNNNQVFFGARPNQGQYEECDEKYCVGVLDEMGWNQRKLNSVLI